MRIKNHHYFLFLLTVLQFKCGVAATPGFDMGVLYSKFRGKGYKGVSFARTSDED